MSDALFLGIDGGGSGCRARIRDSSGTLLGEGAGGPANVRLDPALVMSSILTASRDAARAGGFGEDDLRRMHAGMGLAGAHLRSAGEQLLREPHPFRSVAIDNDAYTAWLGAFEGADGAILILGTGSAGLAVIGGKRFNVSGGGAEVSDEASGMAIGREAIRRTLWAHDGRAPHSSLSKAMLRRFGNDLEKIIAFATDARPADYARFVPIVLEHAEERDPLALALLWEAAGEATRMVNRLLEVGAPSVCLLGGLAKPLAGWLPPPVRARLSPPRGDAMDGAILLARRAPMQTRARA
jgi:glucosamine kinase